jgi:energy-converting hydrogenase A subunit N
MLDRLKDIVRKTSINVCIVNCGGCNGCDVELVACLSPRYDLEQYGIYLQNNPRDADIILLTGPVTEQWEDKLRRIYAKTPEPKLVLAVGNCPQTGSVFAQEGGRVSAPASNFIPIDAAVSGCPPSPPEIINAILNVAPNAMVAKSHENKKIKDDEDEV